MKDLWWRYIGHHLGIREYAHIISLGSSCRTAYHIRKTFPDSKAFPFDWWTTPPAALAHFLEEPDLDKLYHPDLLETIIVAGRKSVINTHYGIRLHHEFPKNENGVIEDFRDHIAQPRKRTEHLMRRFRCLKAKAPLLFVKSANANDPRDPEAWTEGIARVEKALRGNFGLKNFHVLLINTPIMRTDRRFSSQTFPDAGADWRGDAAAWTNHLSRIAKLRR